ncbi:MAG: allantoinase [Phycisphaerales bacterium]|nr:allantoinase [Phycisphaerales bacterium]
MPWDLLIRGGEVVTPTGVRRLDVAIEDGSIVELAPDLIGQSRETIDATGLHIFPGLIDPHVHFNEPGRTEWEGFATGSAALAAGGGTCFFDMPLNAHPPTLDGESFDLKLAAAERSSRTDFALWGGLTPDNLDKMEELADRGVIGFKAFMSSSGIDDFARADDLTLYRGMKIAAKLGLPVAVHAESEEITARLSSEIRARGGRGWRDYLASRPIVAEVEATQRAITLAAETGCRLHVVHVSNSRSSELVRLAASHSGANVTCETCPHYLTLTDHDLERLGAPAKCAPPLRTATDVEELWQDLADGKFAFIASDHSPAPASMKTGDDVFTIWGGVAGIQSTLSILLSRTPRLLLPQVAELTAGHVASRFDLPRKGAIAVGNDADLAIVDVNACYELTRDMLLDRHRLSPYVGRTFHGVVHRTIVRGSTAFRDGKSVGESRGRLIQPRREPQRSGSHA